VRGDFTERRAIISSTTSHNSSSSSPRIRAARLMIKAEAGTDPDKADFLIATERMRCGEGRPVVLIDEVKRFDRPFAWTYARATEAAPRPAAAGHQGQLPSRPPAE
jgi:hypothetical protein